MSGKTTPMKVLLAAIAVCAGAASGETIILQQGAGGYARCTTAPAQLQIRGAKNKFEIRFELPRDIPAEKLARARLRVFLPEARKPNMFTEIFCHEIVRAEPGRIVDLQTKYDNGRRAGAVDSVELFAPPHKYWQPYPWLPLGLPRGGRWIEFNVTPLVAKWLAEPAANRGVMLVPTNCPDKRFPSTWEIDIPSASAAAADKRPKLVIETTPLKQEVRVGMTDSLRRICDRSTRYRYRGGYATCYELAMAANEYEALQVVVYPAARDLKNVRLTWTDLAGSKGAKIPAADMEYFLVDWYKMRPNWKVRDKFFRGKLYETVDPLPPAKPVTLRRHVHTPLYFRVRTRPGAAPGLYRGTITVRADGIAPIELSLRVKVWPYEIPRKWNFHTMGSFHWDHCRRFHQKQWNDQLAAKYFDFLLAHRFSPTEQYHRVLSPRTDLGRCIERGMNTVYLSGNFTGTDAEMKRLAADYEKVKTLRALDHTLVYIGDETSKWDEMHRRANLIHACLPGVMVMIGGSVPRKELLGQVDVYDPIIGPQKVYGLTEDAAELVRQSQRRGEEFYWYVAAGPSWPYPNVQLEYPLICSRVLFWMTWKYAVTGFEYYVYNIWRTPANFSPDPAKRYPAARWSADGWKRGWPTNGDGMLFYPGPISSLRFESIRDGIEDWESHQILADCLAAVRHRKNAIKHAKKHAKLIAEAEKLLKVDEKIVASFTRYTMDPATLLAQRRKLGDLIAEFMKIVPQLQKWDPGAYTLAKSAEVRIARQTALRRRMLRDRHVRACETLKIKPLSAEKWNALWPTRTLFAQDFDADGDWDADPVASLGGGRAVAGQAGNKYFARKIRVGIYRDHARAATTTWLRLRYRISKPVPITVFVFDLTLRNNWEYRLANPVVGKWTEVTLNVTEQFREKGGGSREIRAGDALDDVFVFAGKSGEKDLQLLVDDVQLIGRD